MCKRSCFQHLGYVIENGAICYDNECYCKETNDEVTKQTTTVKEDIETIEETDGAIIEEWNYSNQESECAIYFDYSN